jgi:hypothetical protein
MPGQLAVEVRFMRRGDELFVNDGAKLPEVGTIAIGASSLGG